MISMDVSWTAAGFPLAIVLLVLLGIFCKLRTWLQTLWVASRTYYNPMVAGASMLTSSIAVGARSMLPQAVGHSSNLVAQAGSMQLLTKPCLNCPKAFLGMQ
jgi:hypothetical protein